MSVAKFHLRSQESFLYVTENSISLRFSCLLFFDIRIEACFHGAKLRGVEFDSNHIPPPLETPNQVTPRSKAQDEDVVVRGSEPLAKLLRELRRLFAEVDIDVGARDFGVTVDRRHHPHILALERIGREMDIAFLLVAVPSDSTALPCIHVIIQITICILSGLVPHTDHPLLPSGPDESPIDIADLVVGVPDDDTLASHGDAGRTLIAGRC